MIETNGKLRIAYLTSCRELVKEHVGRNADGSGEYRVGSLEALVRSLDEGGMLSHEYELALAVCDDTDEEFETAWRVSELGPKNLELKQGGLNVFVKDIVRRVPSSWRFSEHIGERETGKRSYEQSLVDLFQAESIDVIVSDSYRCIVGPTLLGAFRGHIINVHPAILAPEDPARLPGVFPTRDAFTRAKFGYIIVDDKKKSGIPSGERIKVEFEGREREAVVVPKIAKTGVSVHYITEEIDGGPIILSEAYEFDPDAATEENLRERNYELKRELLPRALMQIAAGLRASRVVSPEQALTRHVASKTS